MTNRKKLIFITGKELTALVRQTFNLGEEDSITPKQLDYVLSMVRPSNYLLANHKIKGNKLTYYVKNHDTSKVFMHRPYHIDIVNDLSQDVVVEKSRQMGLSELNVGQIIYLADTHSFDRMNLLYTFPTYRALQDFYKMRIKPEFDDGYYSTLVDQLHGMSQSQITIRNSTVMFRSSSAGKNMEGANLDAVYLDEYDRQV